MQHAALTMSCIGWLSQPEEFADFVVNPAVWRHTVSRRPTISLQSSFQLSLAVFVRYRVVWRCSRPTNNSVRLLTYAAYRHGISAWRNMCRNHDISDVFARDIIHARCNEFQAQNAISTFTSPLFRLKRCRPSALQRKKNNALRLDHKARVRVLAIHLWHVWIGTTLSNCSYTINGWDVDS